MLVWQLRYWASCFRVKISAAPSMGGLVAFFMTVRSASLLEQRRFEINIVRAEYSGCGRHRSAAAAGPQGTSYRHFKRKPCTTMVQYLIGFQRWHWAGEAQTFAEQQRPRS